MFLCFSEKGVMFLFLLLLLLLLLLFFLFFFILRFRFKGNREKWFDHGSQNRVFKPRFKRLPVFLA